MGGPNQCQLAFFVLLRVGERKFLQGMFPWPFEGHMYDLANGDITEQRVKAS